MRDLCVIFDLDGTLVDSESLNVRVLAELIPEIDCPVEDLINQYRGRKLADILVDIEARYRVVLPPGFVESYRAGVAEAYGLELRPNAGVPEMLSELEWASCVASSAPLEKIRHALTVADLAEKFGSNLFSSYEIGSWKPEPLLFQYAAEQMNYSPHLCVVVEDSESGVKAAELAGMPVFHYTPRPIKAESSNYTAFDNMRMLSSLLKGLASAA